MSGSATGFPATLGREFPRIEFVNGTHEESTEDQQSAVAVFIREGLCRKPASMADLPESNAGREWMKRPGGALSS